MAEFGIERSLAKENETLYHKYRLLKHRLLTIEYEHWAGSFPTGNNHGPSHILRELEYLDHLLGDQFLDHQLITTYELFLAMMSILYHDLGLLRKRKGHADISSLLVQEEKNEYIFDRYDREIISAVVASHSSTKDIDLECERFSEVEKIGNNSVRPRLIAALVRLADELDEDYRRADYILEQRLNIPEDSQFYWRFCQRILGIEPRKSLQQIIINVKFENEDIGSVFQIDGKDKPFLSAFAEKLAKINQERVYVNKFLPEELRYQRILVSVRPLDNNKSWKRPREFTFNDHSIASEFVATYPELLSEPATKWLTDALEFIRCGQLKDANDILKQLEKISNDLPGNIHLAILYDIACVESLRAEKLHLKNNDQSKALDCSVDYIEKWIKLGLDGAWQKVGKTPQNELYRMGCDSDLLNVLSEKKDSIINNIPEYLRSSLPTDLPKLNKRGGGGCVPIGTPIQTTNGIINIENIREGDQILSIDFGMQPNIIITKVTNLHTSREDRCICLNHRFIFTPTQPLYQEPDKLIRVADIIPGISVLDRELNYQLITHVEEIEGYFEIFNLTTDHLSHNYIGDGLICHNKTR